MAKIIFFSVFLLINCLISFYIFIRGLQAIPADSSLRNPCIIIFWTIALSFMCGRLLESYFPSILADLLVWMGSFWLAAMLYFLLAVVVLDLIRLVNHFIHFYPGFITDNYVQAKYITGVVVTGLIGLILLIGHINSILPRVVSLQFAVPRKESKLDHLDIVVASDIHLGTIVGRSRFDHIVDRINRLNPDVILLPGDIVDEALEPVIRQNLGESLLNLKSRYGTYAVTGNHEHIGGADSACAYLAAHKVSMLRDRSVKVADSFYLVGREDRSRISSASPPRKTLAELMTGVDRRYPVILMDHQPFQLSEAAGQGVDLQISGHTHYGQLWPINYIVNRIYELAWGYRKISNTHYYVSNGVGTWGPPVRIGNRPEIVHLRLLLN